MKNWLDKNMRILALIVAGLPVLFATPRLAIAESMPESWRVLFAPLPEKADSVTNPITTERVELGRKLFSDTRLSMAQDLSCNSCHGLETFGVDNKKTSTGHLGVLGSRNSPTVYNAALHFAQFWDGRARDVEEQALGPVLNSKEMAMPSEGVVIERLQGDPQYVELFAKAFPGEAQPLNFKNMGRAIGAFERTLLTPSKFDRYLKGDSSALSAEEKKGVETFVSVGCVTCHNGVVIGGQMYQKLGIIKPYPTSDLGRYEATKNDADRYFFKVPSLRNIEKTGPYFHDGSVETLEEAVKIMAKHQLGRDLDPAQVASIIVFLKALTAENITVPKAS